MCGGGGAVKIVGYFRELSLIKEGHKAVESFWGVSCGPTDWVGFVLPR